MLHMPLRDSRTASRLQQDRRLEVDLLTRLDRQKEAEERDEEDEETRCDEIDHIEETAAAHVNHGAARESRRNFDDVEQTASAHVNRGAARESPSGT